VLGASSRPSQSLSHGRHARGGPRGALVGHIIGTYRAEGLILTKCLDDGTALSLLTGFGHHLSLLLHKILRFSSPGKSSRWKRVADSESFSAQVNFQPTNSIPVPLRYTDKQRVPENLLVRRLQGSFHLSML